MAEAETERSDGGEWIIDRASKSREGGYNV